MAAVGGKKAKVPTRTVNSFPNGQLQDRLASIPEVAGDRWPQRHRFAELLAALVAMTKLTHGAIAFKVGMPMGHLTSFASLLSGETEPGALLLNGPIRKIAEWARVSPSSLGCGDAIGDGPVVPKVSHAEFVDTVRDNPSDPWPQRPRLASMIRSVDHALNGDEVTKGDVALLIECLGGADGLDELRRFASGPWAPNLSRDGAICTMAKVFCVRPESLGVGSEAKTALMAMRNVDDNRSDTWPKRPKFIAIMNHLKASGGHSNRDIGRKAGIQDGSLHVIDALLDGDRDPDEMTIDIISSIAALANVPIEALVKPVVQREPMKKKKEPKMRDWNATMLPAIAGKPVKPEAPLPEPPMVHERESPLAVAAPVATMPVSCPKPDGIKVLRDEQIVHPSGTVPALRPSVIIEGKRVLADLPGSQLDRLWALSSRVGKSVEEAVAIGLRHEMKKHRNHHRARLGVL